MQNDTGLKKECQSNSIIIAISKNNILIKIHAVPKSSMGRVYSHGKSMFFNQLSFMYLKWLGKLVLME